MPTRKANAVWKGDLKHGSGTMKTESGAYEGPIPSALVLAMKREQIRRS